MKVRMKAQILGARNGVRWPAPGGVVDVMDAEARKLLASGLAEPVVEDNAETAVDKRPAERRKRSRGVPAAEKADDPNEHSDTEGSDGD